MIPREWTRGPQWPADLGEAWRPVISRAARAWQQIELASVTEGLRTSALVHVTPDDLPQASRSAVGQGLALVVLEASPSTARVALTRPKLAALWHDAWAPRRDDAAVASLLGYPDCCAAFFADHWLGRGASDLVPYMPTVAGPWAATILHRHVGVRLVPFLPCSGECEAAATAAERYLAVGRSIAADVAAIEAVLRLPVEYQSALGVTIVETPVYRVMAAGAVDPVRRKREGVVEAPACAIGDPTPNGFGSVEAMEAAHAALAAFVGSVRSALDLGAGNGALLAQIAAGKPGTWHGVEREGDRAFAAVPGVEVEHAPIEACTWDRPTPDDGAFDVALLMPGRLLEMKAIARARTVTALRRSATRIVAYSYDRPLGELVAAAGLEPAGEIRRGPGVEVCEVTL